MRGTTGGRELLQAHVRTLMHGQLITVGPETPLLDVARELAAHGIGAVPVVDRHQRLLGLVSTSDLVALLQAGEGLERKAARDAMLAEPPSIDEFATAEEAIDVLRNALIRHLPVTREGRLVGLVTASDLIRHLLKHYPAPEVA
ncbi:MAG: CBS domain-containing protein [Deltaproteobacteria bacterium]|nr:CBS domain-containing protein [Deltaproteobacteria bacterium]